MAGAAAFHQGSASAKTFLGVIKWPWNIQTVALAPDGKSLGHKTTTLDLVVVMLPFVMNSDFMVGCPVVCYTDNVGVVCIYASGHSNKNELASTLLKAISVITSVLGVRLWVEWVTRNSTSWLMRSVRIPGTVSTAQNPGILFQVLLGPWCPGCGLHKSTPN